MPRYAQIKGFAGKYMISTDGKVLSSYRTSKVLKPYITARGYERVRLYKDKIPYKHSIHRLVANAFLPNPEGKPCVNHIDGNRRNNNLSNLEWATQSENMLHAYRVLGNVRPTRKLSDKDLESILKRLESGESHLKIAADYPVRSGLILAIHKGEAYVAASERIKQRQAIQKIRSRYEQSR